ncbi:DUF625-domain-containing protein [Clavulina sp. PMI_390]|nr:DUF625-domain-containing protein [Clavulina sp. PMI_390]
MLSYCRLDDPEFPTFKAAYRDFLKNSAQYQRSFEFRDPAIQRKISQTYRLQFLKDVVLARVIDDSTFNVLNSFILFNQIDIINNVVADSSFLSSLFKSFVTDEDILKASGSTSGGGLGDLSGLFGAPTVNGAGGKGRENAPSPPQSPTSTIPSSSQNAKEEEGSGADLMNDLPLQTKANGVVSPSTKGDVVRFIHQLCMMAKNVQIPTRLTLYRVLVERGLLFALEWALRVPLEESTLPPSSSSIPSPTLPTSNGPSSTSAPSSSTSVPTISILPPTAQSQALAAPDPDPSLLDMVAEVFILLAEFNVAGVRAHIVRQNERVKALEKEQEKARAGEPVPASGKPVTPGGSFSTGAGGSGSALTGAGSNKLVGNGEPPHLMKALIARLGGSRDLPFRNQIGDAIRLLLETPPPTMDLHTADAKGASLIKLREDPINEHFFPVFYDTAIIQSFYKPLLDLDDWKNLRERILRLTREQAALFLFLCDLLCSMLIQHSHRSQYFILSCGISSKIATLLRTRDKHMRLAALRYFRTCIRINNHFVIRHLIKQECFSPILALAAEEADRDNLVSASCQEFFEHIRKVICHNHLNNSMERASDLVFSGSRIIFVFR